MRLVNSFWHSAFKAEENIQPKHKIALREQIKVKIASGYIAKIFFIYLRASRNEGEIYKKSRE